MPRDKSPVVYEGLTAEAEALLTMATPEHQSFALEVAKGSSAAEAYRKSFPTRSHKSKTVWTEAGKMLRRPEVALLVQELRKAGADLTEDGKRQMRGHVTRLTELSYEAQATGNYGAAVAAEIGVGKASQLYTERVVVVNETPEAVRQELARFLGIDDPDEMVVDHDDP